MSLPTTTKAWRYHRTSGGVENNLQLDDIPLPSLPANGDWVLVKVDAVSLNPIDIKLSEVPLIGRFLHPFPAIPGCDGVGRVVETTTASGSDQQPLLKGQLVAFRKLDNTKDGSLAEYVIVQREYCAVVPEGVSTVQAATVGTCGVTAVQAIVPFLPKDVDSSHTKRIFINGGSGGAGTFQIQVAKLLGVHVTTACSAQNAELCKGLGADRVIDYRQGPPVHEVLSTMAGNDPNGPEAFDLVVDNVGLPWDLYRAADKYLRPDGNYILVGANISASSLWHGLRIYLVPSLLGNGKRKLQFMPMKTSGADTARVLGWMAEGKIKIPIEHELTFQDVPEAYKKLKGGRTRGKIVVRVS